MTLRRLRRTGAKSVDGMNLGRKFQVHHFRLRLTELQTQNQLIMGYYLNHAGMGPKGKVQFLKNNYKAEEVKWNDIKDFFREPEKFQDKALVCVVNNEGLGFSAAGLMYSQRELDAFTQPNETRPMTWLLMDKGVAWELAGYSETTAPVQGISRDGVEKKEGGVVTRLDGTPVEQPTEVTGQATEDNPVVAEAPKTGKTKVKK